jgi:predicted DsbA family dithiol-disulfide isomerase
VSDSFKIEIWSDVVCPFCALGEAQLRLALARFDHADECVVSFHAFELDPNARTSYDQPIVELVARKYGSEVEAVRAHQRRMQSDAASIGVTFDFEKVRHSGTFDAHRVIALANKQGLGPEMHDRLLRAYFAEGELVSDHATLARLARDVEVTGTEELLASDRLSDVVRRDEERASDLGISGVPAMLFDGKFMVLGAQGPDAMLETLQRAWARRSAP